MIKIAFIRHFATKGNLEKRYIGTTDEPLCEEGKKKIKEMDYPRAEEVFASPLKRCIETAKLIYPEYEPVIYEDLKECNFGNFENKNYIELAENKDYQDWIDSNGILPFPNGESLRAFKARSTQAFGDIIGESIRKKYAVIAIVAHGGTIMSILDEYSCPHKDYFSWQVSNGNGFLCELDEKEWRIRQIWSIH